MPPHTSSPSTLGTPSMMSEQDPLDLLLRGLHDFPAEDESSTHRGDDLGDHDSSSSSRPRTVDPFKILTGMRCVRNRQVDYRRLLICPIYKEERRHQIPGDRIPRFGVGIVAGTTDKVTSSSIRTVCYGFRPIPVVHPPWEPPA